MRPRELVLRNKIYSSSFLSFFFLSFFLPFFLSLFHHLLISFCFECRIQTRLSLRKSSFTEWRGICYLVHARLPSLFTSLATPTVCRFTVCRPVNRGDLITSYHSALTLIRCPFHPVLPQWHVKDPGHPAKGAGGRLHLNTRTFLTQRSRSGLTMLSRHSVGTYQLKELTRNSSGNT